MKMRIHTLSLASALLLVGFGAAEARTFASPPTYGGRDASGGGFATCRLFNAGPAAVSVTLRQILNNNNVSIPLASDTCGAGLASVRYCAFTGSGAGNVAFSCRLDATGPNVGLLRGVMEVTDSRANILNALPVQ